MAQGKLYTSDHNLADYGIPYRGLWLQTPTYGTPPDGLRACKNVLVRSGILTHRPGYTRMTSDTFGGTPVGAHPYVSINNARSPIIGTTTSSYQFNGTNWQDITGTATTGTSRDLKRYTSIVLGADTDPNPLRAFVFETNGVDGLRWTFGTGNNFQPTGPTGFPDSDPDQIIYFTDICTIADKIVGIVPPYLVAWSTTLMDPTHGHFSFENGVNWPADNRHQEASTPDRVVAIRNLGSVAGCVYKQRSLWNVSTTGAQAEAAAFRFDLIGMYDGPAGPAAVVDCNGSHMRMTLTGRLGFYNGGSHSWIGDGAWPFVRDDLDVTQAYRLHGWYDPQHDECYFIYPSLANESKLTGLVIITFPKPEWGIETFGVFVGQLAHEITASTVDRSSTEATRMILASNESQKRPLLVDNVVEPHATDDGTSITGHWQPGLAATPGREPVRVESVETFASRGEGYGALDLQVVYSWTLADEGKLTPVRQVNLELPDEPVRADDGFNAQGRFLGVKYSFDSADDIVQYKGATLKAQKSTL